MLETFIPKYEITYSKNPKLYSFDCINHVSVHIRRDEREGMEDLKEWYLVNIEPIQATFCYNLEKDKFYLEVENIQRSQEQVIEIAEATKDMTDVERNQYRKDNYINSLIRNEYFFVCGDKNVNEIVKGYITSFWL